MTEAENRAAAFTAQEKARRAREGRQRKTGDPREDRRRAQARTDNPLRGLIDAFDAEAARIRAQRNA